ncbi:MAG: hypothetical protein EZS28_037104, partial [Streblomastix strix]
ETTGSMNSLRRAFGMTPNPQTSIKLAIPTFPYEQSTKLKDDSIQDQVQILFSNKDGSAEFNQFLNFIGSRIQLQGFDGYSGDLDVSDKHLDGPFSQDHKRFIGNDNVVIVFQQPGAEPYKCYTLIGISELNEVIINVTPIKKQEALMMIKNLSEQLRILHLIKEQKKKKKEIEGQEDVFLRIKPRGSGRDEPYVEGGFSDQPETDILVTYRSTTPQQQSSSTSSEHSSSPVPIFDEDLTYRSYNNAKSDVDVDVDDSANYSDNLDERASSESDRNSFLQKLFAVEQSIWIGPRNKIRFEGMVGQEMLRIAKKVGIGQERETNACCY